MTNARRLEEYRDEDALMERVRRYARRNDTRSLVSMWNELTRRRYVWDVKASPATMQIHSELMRIDREWLMPWYARRVNAAKAAVHPSEVVDLHIGRTFNDHSTGRVTFVFTDELGFMHHVRVAIEHLPLPEGPDHMTLDHWWGLAPKATLEHLLPAEVSQLEALLKADVKRPVDCAELGNDLTTITVAAMKASGCKRTPWHDLMETCSAAWWPIRHPMSIAVILKRYDLKFPSCICVDAGAPRGRCPDQCDLIIMRDGGPPTCTTCNTTGQCPRCVDGTRVVKGDW